MATDNRSIQGIVEYGVIVPQVATQLPEGTRVEIVLSSDAIPPELQTELASC